MNTIYTQLSQLLNEKLFTRHRFFNPNRIQAKAAQQRQLLANQRIQAAQKTMNNPTTAIAPKPVAPVTNPVKPIAPTPKVI